MKPYKRYCKCEGKQRCTCGAKWYYKIDLPKDPVSGARKQKQVGAFNTQKEAIEDQAKKVAAISDGTYFDLGKNTFKDVAQDWYEEYELVGAPRNSTLRARTIGMKKLFEYFNQVPISDVTHRDYQKALNLMRKEGKHTKNGKAPLSINTISNVHSVARMIFKYAMKNKLIVEDPSEFASLPKEKKTVQDLENKDLIIDKYLERNELLTLLDVAKKHGVDNKDYVMFAVLAYTGMRTGEMCALKWTDINFDEKSISITKTIYNPSNNYLEYSFQPPKNGDSREFNVPDYLLDILRNHRKEQSKRKLFLGERWHDGDFVFARMGQNPERPIHFGRPEMIKKVTTRFSRLIKLSGINKKITPHSLRHTCVSLMAEAEVPLPDIQYQVGHTDEEITTRIYMHVTKERKKRTSDKFSEYMRDMFL